GVAPKGQYTTRYFIGQWPTSQPILIALSEMTSSSKLIPSNWLLDKLIRSPETRLNTF
ncbi:hypothetical protein TorRG33x02_343890, partial [Trema orientale]